MRRHCPRCAKPAAIAVTTKSHATRLGEIEEVEWRCEDCFFHFKLHTPLWDWFWMAAGALFAAAGIGVIAGLVHTKHDERTIMTLLLLGSGLGAIYYSARLMKTRAKAPPVVDRSNT